MEVSMTRLKKEEKKGEKHLNINYTGLPIKSAALNRRASRNYPENVLIVPPLIEEPLGKDKLYRY